MALLSPVPQPGVLCTAGAGPGVSVQAQPWALTSTHRQVHLQQQNFTILLQKTMHFPHVIQIQTYQGYLNSPGAPGAPSLHIQSTCTGSMGDLGLLEPEPDSFQSLFCRGSCAQHHHSTPNRDFSFKSPVPKGSQLQNHPGGIHLPEATHPPCTPHAAHGRDARNINFHLIMHPGNNHWRNCKHLSVSMGSGTRVSLARG